MTQSLITNCPICGSDINAEFINRPGVPVHQHLLMPSADAAVNIERGDLELVCCQQCGFIYNRAFDIAKLSYDKSYDNTQSCSSFFLDYQDDLAQYMITDKGVDHCRIVEVGCGKGLFLRRLVKDKDAGNIGFGFDPSYVGPLDDLDGRLHFEQQFYGSAWSHLAADVVVCRHVIEHVSDPVSLLCAIRQALVHSEQARVFFETPCVEWILRNQVIWDFFYEHCSYWTANSLTTAFEQAGFVVEDVRHVFGGQYLWLEAKVAGDHRDVQLRPDDVPNLTQQYSSHEKHLLQSLTQKIQQLAFTGGVALWGAGAKGVTIANMIDPKCELIRCVVDLNPNKQGGYLPGTGHPIVSHLELSDYGVTNALLMNPNYRFENLTLLSQANLNIKIVDITDDLATD